MEEDNDDDDINYIVFSKCVRNNISEGKNSLNYNILIKLLILYSVNVLQTIFQKEKNTLNYNIPIILLILYSVSLLQTIFQKEKTL